ncbi:myosin-6 [Dorcoceras hygrometricum]|uniref:Myosin-6 n=1 Tax=Dorcoceras hygrometricum TaxID=472368 RepID=A0A2Z7AWK0_9LAMI|nr:myosin-6 [Dorcoceras hygrometricum]
MVKRLATSPHDPLGNTDSAYKNQSIMIAYDIHAQGRAMNPRQRSIDSYMHRDLTQPGHLMTPTESLLPSWFVLNQLGFNLIPISEQILYFSCSLSWSASEFFWISAELLQCAYPARIFPYQLSSMETDRTQTTQKQEKKYEVKPQYEELSKQLIMQHAIINAMKCMRAIKDRIARPTYQLTNHLSRASIPRTVYQPRKSSIRDLQSPSAHHSSVVDARIRQSPLR